MGYPIITSLLSYGDILVYDSICMYLVVESHIVYIIYIYILYLLISSEISYIAWWNPMPPPCRLPAIFFRIPGISRIDLDERENPILCHDFLVGILMYNGGINIQFAIYN